MYDPNIKRGRICYILVHVPSQDLDFQSHLSQSYFSMFIDLRCEVILLILVELLTITA